MIVVELTVACAGKFVTTMTEPAAFVVDVLFRRKFDADVAFNSGSASRAIAKAKKLRSIARMCKRDLLCVMLTNVV